MRSSAVIITHNEERNIGTCINSLRGVVDEIIVVDSESTDRTREIAQELGAQVHTRPWTNYSDQKNYANNLASNPYILSLDADEALSEELRGSLQDLDDEQEITAYRMNRLTNYCGRWVHHGGWYPDAKVRLFPKAGSRWEGEFVHETLVLPAGIVVKQLQGDLLHYSYHSVQDHHERIERYSDLHARSMLQQGKRAGWVKRYLSPIHKFIDGYLLKLGFLDGWAGWTIARLSAQAVRMKYDKLHQMERVGQR